MKYVIALVVVLLLGTSASACQFGFQSQAVVAAPVMAFNNCYAQQFVAPQAFYPQPIAQPVFVPQRSFLNLRIGGGIRPVRPIIVRPRRGLRF